MTPEPSTDGLTFTRECQGEPVRIFMWENCPWFEASAISAAMGIDPSAIDHFDRDALDTDIALYPFDAEPVAVFSPIGVWKFVEANNSGKHSKVASWSRRVAAEFVPEPRADDARLRLTLNPDGSRPDYPNRFTGRLEEWKELAFHRDYKSPRQISAENHIAEMRAIAAGHKAASAPSAPANDEGIERLLARIAERSGFTAPQPAPHI